MGYKVNRVGTCHFGSPATTLQRSLGVTDLNDWSESSANWNQKVLMPNLANFSQFGMVRAALNGSRAWTNDQSISVGQYLIAPEVANGNAILLECTAMLIGRIPHRCGFTHGLGIVTAEAANPWETATLGLQPITMDAKEPLHQTDGVGIRKYENKCVVMLNSGTLSIKDVRVAHFVEFYDSMIGGPTFTNVGDISVQLGFRSIHNADVLEPYDPTR